MLNFKNSCLAAASSLVVAMIVTIDAPEAEAAVQQAESQLLGASLQTSGEITIAQNDGRRGGRGEGARGGRRGGGDGARGGRGGNRGGNGARGGPRRTDQTIPNESGGMSRHEGRGARGGNRGGNDGRGARGGNRGGNDGRGARGGNRGGNDGRGARGGYRGGNDGRGARGVYRGDNRGAGARGGRRDAYRDGVRDGRRNAYRNGVRDGRRSTRPSRAGAYRRGYVNGRHDARRYYRNYRRPARSAWRYHTRYYDYGYDRYNWRYYDRGCRSNGDQVLAGAILGALFGAAVADDDAAGAIIGGFFGAGLGSALNDCDRGQFHYAVSYSFTHGSPYYWHNPYTGVRGVVTAREYYNYGGRRCRWGDAEIYMPDGSFVIDEVRMCQDAYGRWQVARNQ